MTQAQFAKLIECKTLTVSRWERGVFYPLPLYEKKIKELMTQNGFNLRRPEGHKKP